MVRPLFSLVFVAFWRPYYNQVESVSRNKPAAHPQYLFAAKTATAVYWWKRNTFDEFTAINNCNFTLYKRNVCVPLFLYCLYLFSFLNDTGAAEHRDLPAARRPDATADGPGAPGDVHGHQGDAPRPEGVGSNFACLLAWWIERLNDWTIGWLVGWLKLIGWLIDYWSVDSLILTDW